MLLFYITFADNINCKDKENVCNFIVLIVNNCNSYGASCDSRDNYQEWNF